MSMLLAMSRSASPSWEPLPSLSTCGAGWFTPGDADVLHPGSRGARAIGPPPPREASASGPAIWMSIGDGPPKLSTWVTHVGRHEVEASGPGTHSPTGPGGMQGHVFPSERAVFRFQLNQDLRVPSRRRCRWARAPGWKNSGTADLVRDTVDSLAGMIRRMAASTGTRLRVLDTLCPRGARRCNFILPAVGAGEEVEPTTLTSEWPTAANSSTPKRNLRCGRWQRQHPP